VSAAAAQKVAAESLLGLLERQVAQQQKQCLSLTSQGVL